MPKFDRRAVPGEYVIKLVPEARQRPGVLHDILVDCPVKIQSASPVDRFGMAVVRLDRNGDSSELLKRLREHPAVEFVEPNFIDSGS